MESSESRDAMLFICETIWKRMDQNTSVGSDRGTPTRHPRKKDMGTDLVVALSLDDTRPQSVSETVA